MDYKDTLNLPRTDFPMRANLPEREPQMLGWWAEHQVYGKLAARNASGPKFVLHDGPPYANADIHPGHVLNKVLKDIVVKYQNMAGRLCDLVPGWDCHGLPIELQVDKQLGSKKREMAAADFRRECRKYADKWVGIQRDQFRRLGVFARWDEPYLTMSYDYEAQIVRELGKFAGRGALYRKKRPVHWCPRDATALAEAEVEYQEHTSPSIYVACKLVESLGRVAPALEGREGWLCIWTTTPWTLPANLAIAVHPDFTYVVYDLDGRLVIVAKELLARFLADCAPDHLAVKAPPGQDLTAALARPSRILAYVEGRALEGLTYRHPFLDRISPVVLGEHVTLDAGTGLVHTAPGHGHEDYEVGHKYGLDVSAPVDNRGRFTAEVGLPDLAGVGVFDANPRIVDVLADRGALLNPKGETLRHSYPHCWRCHGPVIFRATDQWFIALDNQDLRKKALEAIDHVRWIPHWGRERIYGMMEGRPDWCISRQRSWGVPIAVFYCETCNEPLVDQKVMDHVAARFEQEGADAWFEHTPAELIPTGTRCACGGETFRKETDILDVWFDSGASFAAVCEKRPNLRVPADLYLEGSDQHRGWFNSALVISVGTRDKAPYRQVLTHGFVVDSESKKMSKSLGNYVAPDVTIKKYGAEILRLWVAAEDYRDDVRLSDEILTRLADGYRKIRNTVRYALSNLYDYDPAEGVDPIGLTDLDRWALGRLSAYTEKVRKAYEEYEFHVVYHATIDFCAVDLSAFYFDVLKDRLYASGARSPLRRAAQSVLWRITHDLLRLVAPVMSFTAEEAWRMLPGANAQSVFLGGLPEVEVARRDEALEKRFDRLLQVRAAVQKALEEARVAKIIGSGLEARVTLAAQGELLDFLQSARAELARLCIVSQVDLAETFGSAQPSPVLKGLSVRVDKARGEKCERCWVYAEDRGVDPAHPTLCGRCAEVVREITA